MRILLIGDYPRDPRLGSSKVLLKLQEAFRELGHACDLLLGDDIGTFPRNGYARQALAPLRALDAARRAAREHGPYDVIDVASAEGLWLGAFRRALFGHAVVISRSNGLEHMNYRRMLDDHSAGLLHKSWPRRIFHPAVRLTQVAAAARLADRLLLLNEADSAFAAARGWKPVDAIDVVPHGVSDVFVRAAGAPATVRGRGILFCGSWTGVKGVAYLVEALRHLNSNGHPAHLTVMGGGVADAEIRRAFPAELQEHVTVVPRAAEADVMRAYREHDVLAWPSTYEGFGMVVVEAMSQRLPVVATPVGCARTLVRHGETGLLVPPRDPAALATALRRMLGDPGLRERCASAAFEQVRDMTWTRTAQLTLDVYARAIRDGHRDN